MESTRKKVRINVPKNPKQDVVQHISSRETLWEIRYAEVWNFVDVNHRGPSRHHLEEFRLLNWMKYNRRILNKNTMQESRKIKFMELINFIHQFHRVNQYK